MNLLLGTGAIAAIITVAVVVVLLLAFAIWWISTYNKIMRYKNTCEEAFHNIDIYLKKRYDLIPNLVETVKDYAKHESETLTTVIQARSAAQSAQTTAEKIEANNQLSAAMRNFNLVVERYPELKANTNFMNLQSQLSDLEVEIAHSRKYYNATVKQYNSYIICFPANIVAKRYKCQNQIYFELDNPDEERQTVKVSF